MTRSANSGGRMAPRGHKTIKRKPHVPGDDALELLREQGVESLLADIEAGIAADEGPRQQPAARGGTETQRRASETAPPIDADAVRELAYTLWEERGRPEGDPDRDWHEAERQLRRRAAQRPTVLPAPILAEQSRRPIAQSSARHLIDDRARRAQRARR